MKYWLMKTEPSTFSISDLEKSPNKTTCWEGVRNYQARNFIRDEIKVGDKVIFYHSNSEPPGAVGICEVIKEAYPDHFAFDSDNKYYDPKSVLSQPIWYMVDIKLIKKFNRVISLAEIKNNTKLSQMKLVQKGNRLSVFPITRGEYEEIIKME